MAREYGSKRLRRGSNVPQQMLVMVMSFMLGYFTASIFDINALSRWLTSQVLESHQSKSQEDKEQVQKEQAPTKPKFEFYTLLANEKGVGGQTSISHSVSATQQTSSANSAANVVVASTVRKVNSDNMVIAAKTVTPTVVNKTTQSLQTQAERRGAQIITPRAVTKTVNPTVPHHGNFVIQVASFKSGQDAEHMKGLLILKGFEVMVLPVATPNQGIWFRVLVGPYPNRILAVKAQSILAKTQGLKGIVRNA